MRKRLFTLAGGLLLAVLIGYTSTLSTQYKHALHTQGLLHPWLHFAGFALLTVLLIRATTSQAVKVILFATLLFFGWATEEQEGYKNGWPIEWKDVHTDEIGVTLGFVSALATDRRSHRLQRQRLDS